MDNFNDLKNIWQNQPDAQMPSLTEITEQVRKRKTQMIMKKIFGIVAMSLTILFIGYLAIVADFKYATTKIGMVIIIIAVAGALVVNTQLLKILLNTADSTAKNSVYLEQLKHYRSKQGFMQKTGVTIYYIFLSVGIIMYMFEFLMRNTIFGITTYAITLAWIAFNWFYIKPKTIKKEEHKTNALIAEIENISKQLTERPY